MEREEKKTGKPGPNRVPHMFLQMNPQLVRRKNSSPIKSASVFSILLLPHMEFMNPYDLMHDQESPGQFVSNVTARWTWNQSNRINFYRI